MKKVKGLLATLVIFTMMVGILGWISVNQGIDKNQMIYTDNFTTQEDSNPKRF